MSAAKSSSSPSADPADCTGACQVVIVGGGPAGYEAALVAVQLGATVTLIEATGCGGSAVITDVVPSKTLISAATSANPYTGIRPSVATDAAALMTDDGLLGLNRRILELANAQSRDIRAGLVEAGVKIIDGTGRLAGDDRILVSTADGELELVADVTLLAVGAHPRELDSAKPDGERILTWKQLYDLEEPPAKLIVVGSGVTGAEFAGAYDALGVDVVLVSSRDQVLPGEDPDAAALLEDVFRRRGMEICNQVRAESAVADVDGVSVTLSDGRVIRGSHCLMAVGSIPNTGDLGLEEAGVAVSKSGHIVVDGVSRTTARGVYAAGDCTGVFPLASVAAMQGRIAMWHAMGDAVTPLQLDKVSATIFTDPEIATVGVSQAQIDSGEVEADVLKLSLATNPRAKMQGITDGFVKLFARKSTGTVLGGVIVGPRASELLYAVTMAVQHRLTIDDVANTFTVYPSLSGSVAEAARRLHKQRK